MIPVPIIDEIDFEPGGKVWVCFHTPHTHLTWNVEGVYYRAVDGDPTRLEPVG